MIQIQRSKQVSFHHFYMAATMAPLDAATDWRHLEWIWDMHLIAWTLLDNCIAVHIATDSTFKSKFIDEKRKSDLKLQILPIFLASFHFEFATAPKVSLRFWSNFANVSASERYEKSDNFSAIAIMVFELSTGKKIIGGCWTYRYRQG